MILHLNPSEQAALLRAVDYRKAKIGARIGAGSPKTHDTTDAVVLNLIRDRLAPTHDTPTRPPADTRETGVGWAKRPAVDLPPGAYL